MKRLMALVGNKQAKMPQNVCRAKGQATKQPGPVKQK